MEVVLASEDMPEEDPEMDAKGKKKMPEAFLKMLMKKKGIKPAKDVLTEIPAGGGFVPRIGNPQYTKNVNLMEIPDDGPTPPASGVTPPASKEVDTWSAKVGTPQPTGTPTGSFASGGVDYGDDTSTGWSAGSADVPKRTGVNYGDDTATGWSTGPSQAATKKVAAKAPGTPDPNRPPDGPTKFDTLNKAPRSSIAQLDADEDLDWDVPDNLQLPDGSFFIANKGDLQSAIGKVKNADNTNPRKNKPIYTEVKRHIAKRAQALGCPEMVPADWQMMMAMHAELEIAATFSDEERKDLAKKGLARPDGSYPIRNMVDLRNAMQAFGRANPSERASVKAWIAKRAKALGASPVMLNRISGLGAGD
jgi:hypothetical protein